MGSVKNIIIDDTPAGRMYQAPDFDRQGVGVWNVRGTFSVGDLKHLIPPIEIPHKDVYLAMMAGLYWEHATSVGFQNPYLGMLDANNQITDVATLLARGETSNKVIMRLAMTPHSLNNGELTDRVRELYHTNIREGRLITYVGDCECLFRFGLPLGSSWYKRLAKAAGYQDQYEQVAKLDETIELLEQIRATSGIYEKPEVISVLQSMGLDSIPNPGWIGEEPFMNYDSKFDPSGDNPYSLDGAKGMLHLSDLAWEGLQFNLRENAFDQFDYAKERDVCCIDGKVEVEIVDGFVVFTDFACNPDENRLMIPYGNDYLLPTNKEIARAIFREKGVYAAIDKAKEAHGKDWREYLLEYIEMSVIEEATNISVELMTYAIAEVGNRMLGKTVFETPPIESWVGPFLPYASLLNA